MPLKKNQNGPILCCLISQTNDKNHGPRIMLILALETSATAGSVALLERDRLVDQLPLDSTRRSARSLAPTIAEILKRAGWPATAIELVAVTSGPGSFTGLRIGVTSAKAFAYAVGCPVVGVNTLHVIAAQTNALSTPIWSVIDAQRQQLFAARFLRQSEGQLQHLTETHVVDEREWLAGLKPNDVVSGPGLTRLAESLPPHVTIEAADRWQPMAEAVGRLGFLAWCAGTRETPLSLLPQYYRRTAAEEQWEKRPNRTAGPTGPAA